MYKVHQECTRCPLSLSENGSNLMEKLCLRSATASDDVILQTCNPNTVHLCIITPSDTFHLCFLISTHETWHSLADWALCVLALVIILIQESSGNHINATWQSDYNTLDPNTDNRLSGSIEKHIHIAGDSPSWGQGPSTDRRLDVGFFFYYMQDA